MMDSCMFLNCIAAFDYAAVATEEKDTNFQGQNDQILWKYCIIYLLFWDIYHHRSKEIE